MSDELRHQIAIAAMQAQLQQHSFSVSAGTREAIAKFAYLMADAMRAAGEKK